MGLFDIFKPKKKGGLNYAGMLSGTTPIFSQFGTDIYASDVVQQSINCIVSEMKKLRPVHVKTNALDLVPVSKSHIQRILRRPNPLMTTSEFIEKIVWHLFLNYNSFVYKMTDASGKLLGLYPLQPKRVDFLESPTGELFVEMFFRNGTSQIIPYSSLLHIRKNYSVNDFMGGNEFGEPDNNALLKTLDLNHTLLEGVAKAMKSSFSVNGVVKYNTMVDKANIAEKLTEFEKQLQNSESGLLGLDLKGEYIPITRDIQLVDEGTLKFIDEKILRSFGVPLPILTGDYTKEQYEAFYQKTLEPLIIAIGQTFTDGIFSPGEIDFGNEIQFFTGELIFMTMEQKLEMIRLLGDAGEMFSNEKRKAFGLVPLEELEGVRMQSLNYVNSDIANNYQLKNAGGENNE